MGTRIIDPQPLIFDHAAQFFTVSDSQFAELVDSWLEKGLVQEWQGIIGKLDVGGQFVSLPSSPPRYVGVNGMRPLADSLLSEVIFLYSSFLVILFYNFGVILGFFYKKRLGWHRYVDIWKAVPHCLIWCIWRECNSRSFEDGERNLLDLKFFFFQTFLDWLSAMGFFFFFCSICDLMNHCNLRAWMFCPRLYTFCILWVTPFLYSFRPTLFVLFEKSNFLREHHLLSCLLFKNV